MAEFASKGVAGAGLGLGIAGTAMALLNSGLFNGGNTLGGDININREDVEVARLRRGGYYNSNHVSHYELDLVREIAGKDSIIAAKNSELYTNSEIGKVYADLNAYKLEVERRFAYDERLIAENKCEIEKVDAYGKCNYYKMDKVIRPWDICPKPWEAAASESSTATAVAASARATKTTT